MFHLDDKMCYYFYPSPADMRKGFHTLSGLVTNHIKPTVQQGEVFIFINRRCDCMKILHMEWGGLVVYHLKLESGAFKLPVFDEGSQVYHSSRQEVPADGSRRLLPIEKKLKKAVKRQKFSLEIIV